MDQTATAPASAASLANDERELWSRCHTGCNAAREEIFLRYLPVARRVAWRFMRDEPATPMEFAELLQLASVGLLQAIDRYKTDLGVPFRYYCTRRIGGAILDGIGKASEVNEQITTRRRLERERLRSLTGDKTAPQTLEDKLNFIGDLAAELAVGLMLEDSSMYLADERDPARDAYETAAWKQAVQHVDRVLAGLPTRERSVIRLHYTEGIPFDQIAELMSLSKGRISQLHKAALALMRKRLSDVGRFRFEG